MALGYTASFSTSHIRPYTGPTGPAGGFLTGTGGIAGASSATGETGPRGPTGITGFSVAGTYLQNDPTKPAFGYYVLRFSDAAGNEVTAAPRGLTGQAGPVVGAFPNIYNTDVGTTGIFNGITTGTIIGHANAPYFGVCGSTLTFRRLGVSGDLVFYSDLVTIGTGPTYSVVGISGPNAASLYGTVLGQSVGELAYLIDKKSVKDAFGLTFTDQGSIVPPDAGTNGLTWGTISPKLYNTTNFYHVHGNEFTGVQKDPFVINNSQGSVHLVYAPFTLDNITFTKHAKDPISHAPHWKTQTDRTFGSTAEFGESHHATLIIKNGPAGISFSNRFYFDPDNNKFSTGVNIVNCLSYDEGVSWLCTVAGKNYNVGRTDTIEYGACCNSVTLDCDDFISLEECEEKEGYDFYLDTTCASTPCGIFGVEGSCCLNKNSETEQTLCIDSSNASGIPVTQEFCDRFGGQFRPLIECDPEKYPCDPDVCEEDFGEGGACCEFTLENGNYVSCSDNLTADECFERGEQSTTTYTIFQGVGTYCSVINCCDSLTKRGACCLSDGLCMDETTPEECTGLGGIYMGHNTVCETTPCVCTPPKDTPSGGEGGASTSGACCSQTSTLNCCLEGQHAEDCSQPGQTFYPNQTCSEVCPNLPLLCDAGAASPTVPLGKCCKNCSSCSQFDFTCNTLYIQGGCGQWDGNNHANSDHKYCGDSPLSNPIYPEELPFNLYGGFPTCSCTDEISEISCKSLFGDDANWTPGQKCHVTESEGSICSDPKIGIGTCCHPRFNDDPVGGFEYDGVDCLYDGTRPEGFCTNWECSSCVDIFECATIVESYYPIGSQLLGIVKTADNGLLIQGELIKLFYSGEYGPLIINGGNGNKQPFWRAGGDCVGDNCNRRGCGGCPSAASTLDTASNPVGGYASRCSYCSEYMTFPEYVDDVDGQTGLFICPA